MSPRRVLAVVAVGALTLALAACDHGSDEPTAAPSPATTTATPEPTTSAPPTEETTSAAPEVPPPNPADFPGMDQQTEEGAKQAFRFYIAVIVHAHRSGDSSLLESRSTSNCQYCATVARDVAEIREKGAFWGETPITSVDITARPDSSASVTVTYAFDLGEHQEVDPSTGQPSVAPARTYGSAGRVVWVDDGWRMDGLSIK